jgi:hypothetical protein
VQEKQGTYLSGRIPVTMKIALVYKQKEMAFIASPLTIMEEQAAADLMSSQSSNQASEASSLRLLLHCVDGAVPYLTPHLLEKYFPAHRFGNVLCLGLAVRDTCIAPIYTEAKGNEKAQRVRGYTFSTTTKPDPWLLPYHRVTVCTFDMLQDAERVMEYSGMDSVSKPVHVTDTQVQLWTPNGRTSLKTEQYRQACRSLNSQIQVPLFDCLVPEAHGEITVADRKRQQRKLWTAIKQTRRFTEDFLSTPWNGVWVPVLADGISVDDNGALKEQLEWMTELDHDKGIAGVILLGWHRIPHVHERECVMKEVTRHLISESKVANLSLVVLNVLSLEQLFEVAVGAADVKVVVGTNLPGQWALLNKAFVLNLSVDSIPDGSTGKEPPVEKPRIDKDSVTLDADGCFDLHGAADNKEASKHPWFRDKRPIVHGCKCLTCQLHTRSYVYHMVCAKELLAEILLFNHNLHHMLILLEKIDEAKRLSSVAQFLSSLRSEKNL